MNIFHLGSYQFQYYICHHTQSQEISVCFVPFRETALRFYHQAEDPQKITYEIYNLLEDLLGSEMDFKPLFLANSDFFEIKVSRAKGSLLEVCESLRGVFRQSA